MRKLLFAFVAMVITMGVSHAAMASDASQPIMRIFEFVIAPNQVDAFMEAGRQNLEASVRDEPGVISMYCVTDKTDPTKLYVVEVYRDPAAYEAHIKTPHFTRFVSEIQGKVISRRVIETNPAFLGTKPFNWAAQ